MSQLTIGRCGLDVELEHPADFSQGGERLTLAGDYQASSVARSKVLRQQLLGLPNNPWEPVVPVTWSEDSTADGYYRVLGADVSNTPVSLNDGFFNFAVQLERIPHYRTAIIEAVCSGDERVNAHSITAATPWHAVPAAAVGYDASVTTTAETYQERVGPGGTARFYDHATTFFSSRPTFRLEPADFYDMAATIKVGGFVVVGRQIYDSAATDSWEISNGLIKITGVSSATAIMRAYFPDATYADWGTPHSLQVGKWDAGGGGDLEVYPNVDAIKVLANSAAECILRLEVSRDTTSDETWSGTVDLRLRRGSYMVDIQCKSRRQQKWGLGFDTVTAVADSTYGFRPSADDADGNRLCTFTSAANTIDTTNGVVYRDDNHERWDVGVGCELDGAAAVDPNRQADLATQYFAAMAVREQLVGATG